MKRASLSLLMLALFSMSADAQPVEPRKPTQAETANAKNEKDAEAERIRERRANAQSLLISLAADAGNYTDQTLRARTFARIADVLWDADPERARAMFRKAWDAAEVVDEQNRRITLEEIQQQEARRGSVAVTNRPSIRSEVVRMAARRDRKLGEELLAKLTTAKQEEAKEATDRARSGFPETPEAITQRLTLARQLLEADVERAIQFADPALTNITKEGVDFLSYLRDKDVAAADRRYSALLARAVGDAQADANTVSLLASYLFTPHIFVQFSGTSANTTSSSRSTPPADVSPDLRTAFFRAAAEVFLRPLPQSGQDQGSAGIVGKYLMMKRLMPLFEQFAARETAEAVRAHLEALANTVSEEVRQRDDNSMREGIRPPQKTEDREKSLLERIDRTKPGDDRDQLFLQLARLYTEQGDMRAREVIDRIDDSDLRKQALPFIDAMLMFRAVNRKDADAIAEIVRLGTLNHFQKAWALSRAAVFLATTDRDKSLSVLDEANAEARRIDASDADRPRAMLAIANATLTLDRNKVWDLAYDIAKAANSAETFTGEDGAMKVSLITKGMASTRTSSSGEFDIAGVFGELAKDDYNRAIELARLFERQAPRASVTITIARTVLEEKKKTQ
jgi:hypothetical protein